MSFDNRSGLVIAAVASSALGALVVAVMMIAGSQAMYTSDAVPAAATPEFGRQLLRETPAWLGPDQPDPAMRFTGSRLACASCHLETGAKPGTLSLFQAAARYPRFSGRDGGTGDLRDRINGCMQRSMNGRPLPRDSVEMIAMESYILSLAEQFAATAASRRVSAEPPGFIEPDRAANVDAGQVVFTDNCAVCHGGDGQGLMATTSMVSGFQPYSSKIASMPIAPLSCLTRVRRSFSRTTTGSPSSIKVQLAS